MTTETMDTATNDCAGNGDNNDPPPAAPSLANEPVPATSVEIKVRNKDNDTFFKVKTTIALGRIKAAWCARHDKEANSVRFLFDGQRIQDTDTPASLDLETGDTIDVFEEQTGGDGSDEIITVTVRDSRENEIAFRIKPSTQLGRVMDSYCEKHRLFAGNPPRRIVHFLLDGTNILENDTAELLDLKDGDVIEVFQKQHGGGY